MNIEFTTRNYDLGEHLKNVTEQKLNKLDKYFGDKPADVKVCLKKEGTSLVTEVMLSYGGKLVRATNSSDNFYDNLDVVLPRLEGQIRKYRTRFDKNKKNAAFKEVALYDNGKVEDSKTGIVVKEKRFALVPLSVEEAAEELELLGHSFYVFLDKDSGTMRILYKRNDGDLGLIEPFI